MTRTPEAAAFARPRITAGVAVVDETTAVVVLSTVESAVVEACLVVAVAYIVKVRLRGLVLITVIYGAGGCN